MGLGHVNQPNRSCDRGSPRMWYPLFSQSRGGPPDFCAESWRAARIAPVSRFLPFPPDFSPAQEYTRAWLTRQLSRFTFFEFPAYEYSGVRLARSTRQRNGRMADFRCGAKPRLHSFGMGVMPCVKSMERCRAA